MIFGARFANRAATLPNSAEVDEGLPMEAPKGANRSESIPTPHSFFQEEKERWDQGCKRCSLSTASVTAVMLAAPLVPMQEMVSKMLC